MRHHRRYARALASVFLIACSGLALSCGEKAQIQDPKDFYKDLVDAVRRRDGNHMYDVLDSSRRAEIDTLIGMQMANLDKMPPTEQARWAALKGKSKREIYSKILGTDESVFNLFQGDYRVLKVDTFIVVTVQHQGQPSNVMYLRPREGKYLVSQPPRSPNGPSRGMERPPDQEQAAPPAQGQSPAPGGTGGRAAPRPGQPAPANGAPAGPRKPGAR